MNEWVILSGKGGTGKTTLASALIELSKPDAYADCDIDAPNLHLTTQNFESGVKKPFFGMAKAVIDQESCYRCGMCKGHCRFNSIKVINHIYTIDTDACEGCAVCTLVCSANAIRMVSHIGGTIEKFQNDQTFATATLKMGSHHSGLLVSEVKKTLYEDIQSTFSIIDGSPGIGCPVQASMVGAKLGIFVTEPSESGLSDLKRLIYSAQKFNLDIAIVINKYDISQEMTQKIMDMCHENKIYLAGNIPFDKTCSQAINQGKSVIEFDCIATEAIKIIYQNLINRFKTIEGEQ